MGTGWETVAIHCTELSEDRLWSAQSFVADCQAYQIRASPGQAPNRWISLGSGHVKERIFRSGDAHRLTKPYNGINIRTKTQIDHTNQT